MLSQKAKHLANKKILLSWDYKKMDIDIVNDWGEGTYRNSLKNHIKTAIEQWENDRRNSWLRPEVPETIQKAIDDLWEAFGEPPHEKQELFEMIEELAQAIISTSNNPEKSGALGKFSGHNFGESVELFKYVEEHLAIYLAKNFINKINKAAYRLVRLEYPLTIMENFKMNKIIADFLTLVTRNYVWGFDAECIILCRSTMEKAIEDKVTNEMCENILRKRLGKNQYYTLSDRIKVAQKEGLIDKEIVEIAHDIKEMGNSVLHDGPNLKLKKTVFKTIRDTIRVISIMTAGHDPDTPPEWFQKDE